MDKVNVLIVSRMDMEGDFMEAIAGIDPRISVKDVTGQFVAELRSKGRKGVLVDLLERTVKAIPARQDSGAEEDMDTLLAQAEVIFGSLQVPDNLPSRAPKCKWLHLGGTGIEHFLSSGIFESDITITNSRGSLAIPIAEHVLACMFMQARDARRLFENKQNKKWGGFPARELRGSTAGIIGLGAIGGEVASLAKGVGMKVIATRESAIKRESGVSGVDEVYPASDLCQVLSMSDFVVVAVPLTDKTERMIGEAELRAMKSTAYIINIARGPIINEPVLIRALKEGWIAGAALDVFEVEPLSTDSELWELPNVIISSHAAGSTDKRSEHVLGMFCDNLRRYMAGEPLFNVLDTSKGY
ncbi:D-2-hydroxyacid dehydrogenase [Chloroflexota bacterium]